MLEPFILALRCPRLSEALQLDSGSTYPAKHSASRVPASAFPHPRKVLRPSRPAKMERFWCTLREQCLDLISSLGSLHDLNSLTACMG